MKIKAAAKKIMWVFPILLMLCGAGSAHAYVLDGELDDWGATLFSDWVPDSNTAFYNEENNTNPAICDAFEERYDLEAIYFDSDADNFYFAIVTSSSYINHGTNEAIGIDLNGDGLYEFGVDMVTNAPQLNTNNGVWSVDKWNYCNGIEYSVDKGTKLDTYAGAYELYNQRYTANSPYLYVLDPDHIVDEPGTFYDFTYVLEGRIDRTLFGDIACGSDIELQLARISCLKDIIKLNGKVYGPCTPVIPEPTTMLLFGAGLIGLAGSKLKKRRS